MKIIIWGDVKAIRGSGVVEGSSSVGIFKNEPSRFKEQKLDQYGPG